MDVIILITTFVLTVFFDLIIAIEIGVVLSSFMFMKRMSQSIQVQNLTTSASEEDILFEGEKIEVPENVMLYEINGPLFFGAARNFQQTLTNLHLKPKVIIIRMRYVPFIDATGFQSLKEIITIYKERGIKVLLSGIQTDLRKEFEKNQFYDTLGKEFVLDHINQAIEMAKELTMK